MVMRTYNSYYHFLLKFMKYKHLSTKSASNLSIDAIYKKLIADSEPL